MKIPKEEENKLLFQGNKEKSIHKPQNPNPIAKIHDIEVNNPELVLIVDNVETQQLTNSNLVRKEINKSENLRNKVKLAYNLPLGGIAVHFKSKTDINEFSQRPTIEEFGKDSCWHSPSVSSKNTESIGFGKNIPLDIEIKDLKHQIERQTGANVENITQQRYWDTKKLMPVVKIKFNTSNDLDKAINKGIQLGVDGKEITIEIKRNFRIVRCYNCHRFGHRASLCKSKPRCFNCGEETCCQEICTKPSKCCHCTGNHKASSSKCPVFIQLVNNRKYNKYISENNPSQSM